jgi:hypothetical protein
MKNNPIVAVGIDSDLQDRANKFLHTALTRAEYLMEHGSPRVQEALITKFVSAIVKESKDKNTDEELDQLRDEVRAMNESIRSLFGKGSTPSPPLQEPPADVRSG